MQVLDNGSPRLGAVRTFQITVADQNSAPLLAPIANRTINEGRLLSITNSAVDFDLPHQTLTFSLAPGAPAGATVNATNGVFQWRPADFQGGTTNKFTILVQDSGTPPMTATQSFLVIVRDTRSDFTLGIGTTNVLAGSSNAVPIQLASSADLDHITAQLEATDAHLETLNLRSLAAELTSASLEPIAAGLYRLRLDFDPARLQTGSRSAVWLEFNTQLAGHSSIAHLNLDGLTAARTSGEPVSNGRALAGRVFIVEHEPLLDLARNTPNTSRLTIYGHPGRQYQLQSAPAAGAGLIWGNETVVTLPTTYETLERPLNNEPARLFRVREMVP